MVPTDLMQRVFQEYKLFKAKNFTTGLNKIIEEIVKQMVSLILKLTRIKFAINRK